MTRNVRLGLALAVALTAAACSDAPTSAPDLRRTSATASVEPGTCTNLTQLNQLAAVLFTPQSSPNISSVRGKLRNLDGLVRKGKYADAERHAGDIVAFTLLKHNQGGLAGDTDDVEAFTDAVLCFAGIDIDVEEPTNSFFIMPSDTAQVITNIEGTSGIAFPANPVSEPTLVTFALIEDTYPVPGDGPLDTKLDQYPGFIQITKTSETDAPLTQPVVVGVCAQGAIPAEVRDRLRLGHQATEGFEVTPAAEADFISCPVQTAQAPSTMLQRIVDLVLPKRLQAFQAMEFGGGVGGTVTEFSPFAPVDPQLEFGGGVGGTVTEFTRMGLMRSALLTDGLSLMGACPTPIEGAMGSPVREECRPYVSITTRLGTPFTGVPVTWDVTAGGGSVAANTGTCGAFGSTAATTTGVGGRAGVCWTLGAVGANQVRATPSLGGDAVPGVTFSQASVLFDAVANPPAGLVFSLQPPSTVRAGVAFPAAVTVVDKNGERVHGSSDEVNVRLNTGTFVNGITQVHAKAVAGVASWPALPITVPGAYHLLASAGFMPAAAAPAASSPFDVIAGPGWYITIDAGDGQTGTAGQPAPVDPRVRVTDKYGNVAAGVTVTWRRVTSGIVTTIGQSTTDANGLASTTWTLVLGANELRAALTEGSFTYTTFTATGNAP